MRFRVLGPLEVEAADGPVSLPGPRPRALLTALLLQPNAVVSTDRLVVALWDEEPPDAPLNALQQVVARLRSRVPALAESIRTGSGGYALVVADGAVDADLFEALCREARVADPTRAAALLDQALALWRGPAYDEFADTFAQPASVRLAELRAAAEEDRTALDLELGQLAAAVAAARALVARDPIRERPVELLMRALHASGRTPEALDVFRDHRQRLADELGLDPSAELRGLEARIIQDDLSPRAPAQPPAPRRSGLPLLPGGLVGRDHDLRQLLECLAVERMLTLVGPGGVGKTRLALEAAHQLDAPVWWADLTTVPGQPVVDVLAEACGAEIPRGQDPVASLARALRAAPGRFVLDNAESVLDDLAPVMERLVAEAPGVGVLSTSRERLAVAGEHVHLLTPLPLPAGPDLTNPAVQLFLERAHGLERGQIGDEVLPDVAELCRRLDGLPLAIELAATRAPAFGIREFSRHIAEGIDLLGGGRRTGAARHRTLRAVIDASYELLPREEAILLARLSVFPGSFDLEQARAVCADETLPPSSVAAGLARLVEQSLVQTGRGRFRLLETLRTYAAERLDAEQSDRVRARHARSTAARLEGLRWQQAPATEPEVVATLSGMSSDLYLAWEHAVQHDRDLAVELAASVYDYAYARQRRDLLEWGLVVADWDVEHPRLPRALATAATAAWADGDLARAEALAMRGLAAGAGEDDPATARSMVQAANLAMFDGRHGEALERFRLAGSLYAAAGERIQSLMTEMSQCQVLVYDGRSDQALARLGELMARAAELGNPTALSWAHYVTGEALATSDPVAASASYRVAYDEGRRSDNRLFMGLARSSAAALAARTGAPAAALDELERVVDDWADLRNEASQWGVLLHLAVLLVRLGALQDAAVLAGAVREARDRQPLFALREPVLQACADALDGQLGPALPIDEAVAAARRAIEAARAALGPGGRDASSTRPDTPR